MDKLNLHSKDILSGNIEKIGELFPGTITESKDENGNTKKSIDFDLLRQHLSDQLVEGDRERFRLDWPGKRASILKANTPITKTLRPVLEDSVDFETTQNVFIEGDNFEVLKVLQESYLGKVKMIYIDPPYNTGKDFIYRDNFAAGIGEYEEELGVRDDENGGKLVKNTETNGRYHSDWLSMMQERLIVARDLLMDNGITFVSIDENEQANLRKLCDEIFGEDNFVADFIWNTKNAARGVPPVNMLMTNHEYLVCYAKNKELQKFKGVERDERDFSNLDNDPRGLWRSESMKATGGGGKEFSVIDPKTGSSYSQKWAFSQDKVHQMLEDDLIIFPSSPTGIVRQKKFIDSYTNDKKAFVSLLGWYSTENATKTLMGLFESKKVFDFSKPIDLIEFLVNQSSEKDDIILDFFSGSATTAHAVMQLNAEDGGNRKHIQVQLAEPTDPSSEAYKAGYKTIPEISRERIRRAAAKIRTDYAEQIAKREEAGNMPLDTGFRAYKLASSNFTDTRLHPSQTSQTTLLEVTDTIKPDRTSEDILTEVILDLGLTLDLPIEQKQIAGHAVYFVGGNALVACFDDTISLDIVNDIAAAKPLLVVFKDLSFANDEVRINIDIRLKQLSPDTNIKVV